MANNPYVNKVQLADGTSLIDISDATATADKILQGFTAYGADGSKLTGTATGGGGSVTQDQDGFIVLPPDGGGGSSVGGLEYEGGTWTPSEDVVKPTISFTNTHSSRPMYISLVDITQTTPTSNSNQMWSISSWYDTFGTSAPASATAVAYARVQYAYWTTSTSGVGVNITAFAGDTNNGFAYYVTDSNFYPYTNSSSRYWRTGRTYKWIAVWAPTT